MCGANLLAVDHGRVVVSIDQDCCVIDQDLLHLEDQVSSCVRIHLALQLIEQLIVFRIGVCTVACIGCPVCHVSIRIARTNRNPVVVVKVIIKCSKLAPLIIRTAVLRNYTDSNFCQILCMCVGEVIQRRFS